MSASGGPRSMLTPNEQFDIPVHVRKGTVSVALLVCK